jgi:hypothetical protein
MSTAPTNEHNPPQSRLAAFLERIEPYITNPVGEGIVTSMIVTTLGAAFGAAVGYMWKGTPGSGAAIGTAIASAAVGTIATGEAIVDTLAPKVGLVYVGNEDIQFGLKKRWTVVACSTVIVGAAAITQWPQVKNLFEAAPVITDSATPLASKPALPSLEAH